MSVKLPDIFDVAVDVDPLEIQSVGPVGPVTVAGIPDTYHLDVQNLPRIRVDLAPVTLTVNPLDLGIRLEKIPDIRGHLPADFRVGFSLLGVELAGVRLCGEAQVITEPYRRNPCEVCGGGEPSPDAPPTLRAARRAKR